MCKIFAMTNMENVSVSKYFVESVRNEVCRLQDKDGFGYAVLSENGEIGGERTMRPLTFQALASTKPKAIDRLPITLKSTNSFGKIDFSNPKSFIAHGRFSTNSVSLQNTHPFVNDNVAMIHNGVVYNEGVELKLSTTCDSEILLKYWELDGIRGIENNVSGYYAIAILDKTGKLHIIRDSRALLYISYSKTVDSFIFATTPDIIRGVAKSMKWKIENPEEVYSNTYVVFDKNLITSHQKIEPFGLCRTYKGPSTYPNHYAVDDNNYGSYDSVYDSHEKGEVSKFFCETDPSSEVAPAYRGYRSNNA